MLRKFLVTMLVLSLALVPSLAGAEATTYTIGFAVSTLENPFFVAMKDAAEVKAAELGVELMVLDAQDSAEAQASQVEDFITRGVDLLIINPVDSDAIGTAVVACNDAKIPVITVTRASNSGTVVQHLDIDNQEAGLLDAQQLIKDLGGKGNVAILEGIAGSSSAIDREKGFVTALEGT
ncbi:MAG: substrate-binding domain-containing protein, partial [Clostridia bacterium]